MSMLVISVNRTVQYYLQLLEPEHSEPTARSVRQLLLNPPERDTLPSSASKRFSKDVWSRCSFLRCSLQFSSILSIFSSSACRFYVAAPVSTPSKLLGWHLLSEGEILKEQVKIKISRLLVEPIDKLSELLLL